ncbi:alpha/beta hydrolase [Streptomyces sp. LP05-1]|uniref:Alpha/beta hydrolase n=1 Tax=Streptomyces pyxinae TaxID=2970734 RepID=A0ABT2CQH8_9ACTN|nr:alpha/beta hydrolase [Streptomyces sp. LP05-1]MCS0639570.1 alpha/beta hydrolase [Streptomyces sp. LP05-1]
MKRSINRARRQLTGLALALALAGVAAPAAHAAPVTPAVPVAVSPAAGGHPDGSAGGSRTETPATRLTLPRPTGPHAVGRSVFPLADHGRPDPWVPASGDRRLMVTMDYPALPGPGPRARYAEPEEARLLAKGQSPSPGENVIRALSEARVHARTEAVPLPGRHPLVVLSPGFGMARFTLTTLAEDLASRGYVVALVDHAYESTGTLFPDGTVTTCAACEAADTPEELRRVTTGRGQDVSFLLDSLLGDRPAWRHAGMIDARHIGMAGHSIGGAAAVSAMAGDDRIRAGVNMDGTFQDPVPAGGLDGRPFMLLGADKHHRPATLDPSWDAAWSRLDGWKRWVTVRGAGHLWFSDAPVLVEQLGLPPEEGAELGADRTVALVRSYMAAFFDRHLRHRAAPLLDGPTPENPEVVFHRP